MTQPLSNHRHGTEPELNLLNRPGMSGDFLM
jgi:hypothetical protein